MIVVYDPVSMLPTATIESPYTDATIALYEQLEADKVLSFFETSDNKSLHNCYVKNTGGTLTLEDKEVQTVSGSATASVGGSATLTGFAANTSISVDGAPPVAITDTSLTITFNDKGSYELLFTNPLCLDTEFTVTVS